MMMNVAGMLNHLLTELEKGLMGRPIFAREILPQEKERLDALLAHSNAGVSQRAAAILLSSGERYRTSEIARVVDMSVDSVRYWIHRFNDEGIAALEPREAEGWGSRVDPDVRPLLTQLARTPPREMGLKFTTWTLRKLRRYLVGQDIVPEISHETIRRILKEEKIDWRACGTLPEEPAILDLLQASTSVQDSSIIEGETMTASERENGVLSFDSLVDLLQWRSLEEPDRRAYTFLVDGEAQKVQLTYSELDRQARAIAAKIQNLKVDDGRALLLYAPGLEYIAGFFGCLYAGVTAVPAYPPDPARLDRTLPRLQTMVADAQATVALTTAPILSMAEFLFEQAPDLADLQWVATDTLAEDTADNYQELEVTRDTLAFLQYTSGSTRTPRGVMLNHGHLLHNLNLIRGAFDVTSEDVGMIWLPPYHDMGLIGGILQPVYLGAHCVLMSPLAFLQRPFRWLQAVSRYKATASGGPNFAYDLCVRKVTPEQRATLDLSQWQVAFNGAEPVRAETVERFVEYFAPCGFRPEAFYPCYGLAEATLIVSGGSRSEPAVVRTFQGEALEQDRVVAASAEAQDPQRLVGCGQNLPGQQVVVVDPQSLTPCPPDRVGEIWVSGPSVARGYWNQPEETEETFGACLTDTDGGPFLRTGDLGFLDEDGELFVTGRLKDLIIVDGLNHYPQDIEKTVEESHPAVRPGCSAAFSIDRDGRERVIVVAEAARRGAAAGQPLDLSEIGREIRRAVSAHHDLRLHDVVLLKARSIPKTSSGKIQRHACRAGYLAGSLDSLEAK